MTDSPGLWLRSYAACGYHILLPKPTSGLGIVEAIGHACHSAGKRSVRSAYR